MSDELRSWGFWTEVKLDTLERYLASFTVASKRAPTRLYMDLFAGRVDNVRRDDPSRHFSGSTVRALQTQPPFERLVFFELPAEAPRLRAELQTSFPGDRRYKVVEGDCNQTINVELEELKRRNLDWSATFVLVDPSGLDVKWSTLRSIARFKNRRAKTKTEMWILLSHTTIARLAGFDASKGLTEDSSASATSLFGTSGWRLIYDRRINGALTPLEARDLYVDLFRYRLERTLGYRRTLTIEMGNVNGAPIYTMVFASDSDAGVRIMSHVYEQALQQSAEYRAEVMSRRDRQRREQKGALSLFDVIGESVAEEPRYFESIRDDESPTLPGWLEAAL